jgi:hypothetical protein
MQKWEYLRLDVTYNDRTINPGIHNILINGREKIGKEETENWETLQLNISSLGQDGWELVSHAKSDYHEVFYFKRPLA